MIPSLHSLIEMTEGCAGARAQSTGAINALGERAARLATVVLHSGIINSAVPTHPMHSLTPLLPCPAHHSLIMKWRAWWCSDLTGWQTPSVRSQAKPCISSKPWPVLCAMRAIRWMGSLAEAHGIACLWVGDFSGQASTWHLHPLESAYTGLCGNGRVLRELSEKYSDYLVTA